jgi:penicillin-binding protein
MDYTNGDIIAVVSKPGFDSNLFALGITPGQYQELRELDSPFVNRGFDGLYPPGSVFKPFTALMALEEDLLDPQFKWDTPRQWQPTPDWGAYHVTRVVRPIGPVDLWGAIKWSDNVYFADLGLKIGWQAFEQYGEVLGFNSSMPFALNRNLSQIRWSGNGDVLLADSSYGQGEMLVTPLHMTLMYAAIARQDGLIPVPRMVVTEPKGIWLETGLGSENLELIDGVLAYAASDSNALAWVGAEIVRGKTGTSEITQTRQIAWYICYFDNLIMTVMLEGDRSLSSTHAVGVAREILEGGVRD